MDIFYTVALVVSSSTLEMIDYSSGVVEARKIKITFTFLFCKKKKKRDKYYKASKLLKYVFFFIGMPALNIFLKYSIGVYKNSLSHIMTSAAL